mgnify:CR=1 FL=1
MTFDLVKQHEQLGVTHLRDIAHLDIEQRVQKGHQKKLSHWQVTDLNQGCCGWSTNPIGVADEEQVPPIAHSSMLVPDRALNPALT